MPSAPSSRSGSSRGSGGTCALKDAAPRWMITIAFLLLVLLTVVLIWRHACSAARARGQRGPWVPEAFRSEPQDARAASSPAHLIFFHMNGCGWCVRFKPQWQAFVDQHGASLARQGITVKDALAGTPEAEQYKSHISGYPTVLFVRGTRVVRFEGDRTPEGLVEFLQQQGVSV